MGNYINYICVSTFFRFEIRAGCISVAPKHVINLVTSRVSASQPNTDSDAIQLCHVMIFSNSGNSFIESVIRTINEETEIHQADITKAG